MSLKDIFCQDKAVEFLQRAYQADKCAHAYIFAGPEGVGKFTTARQWARLLLCAEPATEQKQQGAFADSCGSCESCELFEADSHPDFHHVYKELIEFTRVGRGRAAPIDVPVAVIREFVIAKVSQRPTVSQRKVFVVSEAEKLNAASQNALLKVLEEPPQFCSIILLCTRMEGLLPTTKSRCQIIRFGPIAAEIIIESLRKTGLEPEKLRYFAHLAQGSLGLARQWAELESADARLYATKKQLLDSLADYELADALELADYCLQQSKAIASVWQKLQAGASKSDITRRAQQTVLRIIISALQDAMKINIADNKKLVNIEQTDQVRKLAARLDVETAAEKIAEVGRAMAWVDSSVNERLIFEQLLLSLAGSDKMRVCQ